MAPWPGYDTSVTNNLGPYRIYSYYSPSEAQRIADEKESAQRKQEREFLALFKDPQVPIIPRFTPPRFWQRPEFHARSRPRPAAMRPRKPTRREKEAARG